MTHPLRRPLQRDDHVERLLAHYHGDLARLVDAGRAIIRAEMRDAGWPSRTPDGNASTDEPASIDYADPTGDLAVRFEQITGDLDTLHEHEHIVRTSMRALVVIAARYIPTSTPSIPVCACGSPLEALPNGGYRGVERVAGVWFAKSGTIPTCARHRRVSASTTMLDVSRGYALPSPPSS